MHTELDHPRTYLYVAQGMLLDDEKQASGLFIKAWSAQRGPKVAAPGGPRASLTVSLWARPSSNIPISVLFLRLVGLLSYGPCMAYFRYFMLLRMALVPLLPHNPWSLPQASLIGPKLGPAGGISR